MSGQQAAQRYMTSGRRGSAGAQGERARASGASVLGHIGPAAGRVRRSVRYSRRPWSLQMGRYDLDYPSLYHRDSRATDKVHLCKKEYSD